MTKRHCCERLPRSIGIVGIGVILSWGQPAIARPAIIESVSGQVQLKRENWKDFHLVSVGTNLEQGDQLKPITGSRVQVICPDLSKRSVKAGVSSGLKVICPKQEVTIGVRGPSPGVLGGISASRKILSPGVLSGISTSIPYIISPRHTLLLNNFPSLYWNSVSGASYYTVQLNGPAGMLKEYQSKENHINLPKNSLLASEPYSFTVKTNTSRTSKEDKSSDLDFRVLGTSEAKFVRNKADQIIQKSLSKQATALLLAELYSTYILPESVINDYGLTSENFKTYTLTADAISNVYNLILHGEQSPILYRTLGDLYRQSGLSLLTIGAYQRVIELANTSEDLEEKTTAQYGLGEVHEALNNFGTAIKFYRQAKDGYRALGDNQKISSLNLQIQSLEQQ